MTPFAELRPADYLPEMPEDRSAGIGVIGLGGVARNAHLPAYLKAGFRVVAGADPSPQAREIVAAQFGIAVDADTRRILDDPDITIVDITLPNAVAERATVLHDAIDAGKHILVQKPFAHDLATAESIVAHADAAGLKVAVNQNARWNPSYRAATALLRSGAIGEPYLISHEMRIDSDVAARGWMLAQERSMLVEYSVHHIDVFRQWAGRTAVSARASLARKPDQRLAGDTIVSAAFDFGSDLLAVLLDDCASVGSDPSCRFRIEGAGGVINGTVGADRSGTGRGAGSIEVNMRDSPHFYRPVLEGNWAVDAFGATMAELLIAVETGRVPETSARDNLETLRMVFAAERAAAEGRTIDIHHE